MSVAIPNVRLFNITLHAIGMAEAVDVLRCWTAADRGSHCRYVVTPNVNHLVLLRDRPEFARCYAEADLVLADGMPIIALSRLFGKRVPERVAGSDIVPALFNRATADSPLRVFLLGAMPEANRRAAEAIPARWPNVAIVGRDSPPLGFEHDDSENRRILAAIADAQPDLLLIGLGAPKQELWAHCHRGEIEAKVALCIGATIDFLAGTKSRAPEWMRRTGLEWTHRIATEPRRLFGRYLSDGLALPGLVWRELRTGGR